MTERRPSFWGYQTLTLIGLALVTGVLVVFGWLQHPGFILSGPGVLMIQICIAALATLLILFGCWIVPYSSGDLDRE